MNMSLARNISDKARGIGKAELTGALSILAVIMISAVMAVSAFAGAPEVSVVENDTALILAVDVSDSVDAARYRLQMEGIARALEDDSVVSVITGGARGGIALTLVTWADHAAVSIASQTIRSRDDARSFAQLIRAVPQVKGEYTCAARMLEYIGERVVPDISGQADKLVLDVSGDGIDNCSPPGEAAAQRDRLLSLGLTINGLPIIVSGENDVVGSGAYRAPGYGLRELPREPDNATTTLDAWYKANIVGGPGHFMLKANGFEDFGRAFRQKFVTEISAVPQRRGAIAALRPGPPRP